MTDTRKCEACGRESENLRCVDLGISGLRTGNLPVGIRERIGQFVEGSHLFCFDCHMQMWALAVNLNEEGGEDETEA